MVLAIKVAGNTINGMGLANSTNQMVKLHMLFINNNKVFKLVKPLEPNLIDILIEK